MSVTSTHNAGFFSCCSVKLYDILCFKNASTTLPPIVDSSQQFEWYKNDKNIDITYDYFEHYNNIDSLIPITHIKYHWTDQFINYSGLDYNIIPLVKKYFSPSKNITSIIDNMCNKYNLNYENTCVLFYRGNDKVTETQLCDYDEYVSYANKVLSKDPTTHFLIQSDETEFIDYMTLKFPNKTLYFKDEIRHMNKCNNTVDVVMKDKNYEFSQYYLAITIIMSKCKYVICGSGNCSLWIIFYRENNNNVYQNLNGKWHEPNE